MRPKFYLYVCIIGGLSAFLSIQKSNAQCNCSPGVPATPVTYYYTLDTTNAPSAIISFPKFDASIGDLNCVVFKDTLSLVATSGVRNRAAVDVSYRFLLSVTNEINGPGVSIFEPATKSYGPTLLTAFGTPTDSITYGPDTLFKSSFHSTNTSGGASYLGSSGNVDFVYTVNGGLVSQQGGIDYSYRISSKYWGGFSLTYYWCPPTPLALKNKKSPIPPSSSNETKGSQPLAIYPNPVSGNTFSIQFNKAVTGNYMVDIVNVTGQKIYAKTLQLNNTNLVSVDMASTPPPGLYYLRAVDQKTGVVYMNKLLVK